MKKFNLFVHKKFSNRTTSYYLDSVRNLSGEIKDAFLNPEEGVQLLVLANPEYLSWEDSEHKSDLEDAFEQAHRVEVHIVPHNDTHNLSHDVGIQVRFYRGAEKLYSFFVVLDSKTGEIGTVSRSSESALFRKRERQLFCGLTRPQQIRISTTQRLDIVLNSALPLDEILRVRYAGTMNDRPPRGGDYFRIERFRKMRKVSSIQIKASPCYEYLVDIGDELILYPQGEPVEKHIPYRPAILRCQEWAVRTFFEKDVPSGWRNDTPVKTVEQLKSTD